MYFFFNYLHILFWKTMHIRKVKQPCLPFCQKLQSPTPTKKKKDNYIYAACLKHYTLSSPQLTMTFEKHKILQNCSAACLRGAAAGPRKECCNAGWEGKTTVEVLEHMTEPLSHSLQLNSQTTIRGQDRV